MNTQNQAFEKFQQDTNQRQIEDNEIVFDFDNRERGTEAVNFTAINLVNAGYKTEIWFAEGQKAPHLHIKNIPHIADLTYEQRKKYKTLLMLKYAPKKYHSILDLNLASRHLIAEEDKSHYKYKTIKKLLCVYNENEQNFAEMELITEAKKVSKYSTIALPTIQNVKISLMEKNCLWLNKLINRTDLNHNERSALMFLYMRLGQQGEARLKEIMQRQKNYSATKTNYLIDYYKKQNKFLGISCKKLIEKGFCNFPLCSIYQREQNKVEVKNV